MKRILILLIASLVLASCEDPIDLELDNGQSQVVVDAFINSDSSLQTVRLTKSAEYFLNAPTPIVQGAKVKITGPNGVEYLFSDQGNGNYTYNPKTNNLGPLDSLGFEYQLQVEVEGKTYLGNSVLHPVPKIDTMTYNYEEAEPGAEEGYYSQFFATDFQGRNDFYWIKAFRNGEPLYPKEPANFILSQNAAFGGDGADGFVFILPIRAAITDPEFPFLQGEVSSVELLSVNEDVWNYLLQVATQASNDGLFATPTANIKSNITDIAGNPQNEVLGVFSMSSISRNSILIQ